LILSNKDRNQLIKYRLEQAKECIDEVEFQINYEKDEVNELFIKMKKFIKAIEEIIPVS